MAVLIVVLLPIPTRVVEVDLIETNHIVGRFTQVVLWDRVDGDVVDRGYQVLRDGEGVSLNGDRFEFVTWRCNQFQVVRSRAHLIRETPFDVESHFRSAGGVYRPLW